MIKVTAIYHFPNTFFPDFFREMTKEEGIELRVLYCYPATEKGLINKKNGEFIDWGADLLSGYEYVFMEHKYKSSPSDVIKMINPDVKKLITKDNTDVVVLASSYWAPTTWMAIKHAKKLGIPLVTRATVEARRRRKWYVRLIRDSIVKKYCRMMSVGIYECEDQRDFLISHGMCIDDVIHATCAVNNDYFQNESKRIDRSFERKQMGIDDTQIVFLYVAGMNKRKRPMDVLLAYDKIHSRYNNATLVFVGDGEEEKNILEYIRSNELGNVIVAGFANREKIIKYYSIADVYILPAENDASPKTLNEAMNFSLPIVITGGVGTSKELLVEGENGFIYDAGDLERLAKIMIWFMENSECIKTMGERSLEIVSQNGLSEVCKGWKNAIARALWKKDYDEEKE